jgi:flap endonuclease-1
MGVGLRDLVAKTPIGFDDLRGKTLAVDTYNLLYQFLSTIRLRDGALLTDSSGSTTSHISGLFSRTSNMMQRGIKLIFVFDGPAPKLKLEEQKRRRELKMAAEEKYISAKKREDVEEMKKYASRTSRLTPEMVDEAKKLVAALGSPIVQAASEGEAQAAYLVRNREAYAEVSEDYDSLLFGVPRLIKNLSITGRKKRANKLLFEKTSPELIDLEKTLEKLGISQNQLVALGLLIGTDYNRKGIPGLGQKKSLKLIKQFGDDLPGLFSAVAWEKHFTFPWQDAYGLITNMPVSKDYDLKWAPVDKDAVIKLMCKDHDFSEERVSQTLEKLNPAKRSQKGLSDFFK